MRWMILEPIIQSEVSQKEKHQYSIVIVKSLSCAQLFATPWTVACQAPPSMGFSRQEYWSGLPFQRYMHPCVHNSTVHNSQDMKIT